MKIEDGQVNPFENETLPDISELLAELESLEQRKVYLIELLDALGYISPNL